MKCNVEWLSAYQDGLLSDDKRAKLEEHLKTCEACAAKLEEFARVEQAAKKIPAPQLSEAYWENFVSRVQNKLAIRERQKTSPAWLETLKSFFRPTTGKLAIAGSVAVIILLTFVSLDQWKKETFRPPVFEAETPVAEGKVDSVQIPAKDETAFRTTEKNREVGLVEEKRLDQPTPERATATLSQKPAENVPAASAPLGRALAPPEGQASREEPSLAIFAERDEAVKGDTIVVTAGRKAEIRREVATSQVKVVADEIEKPQTKKGVSTPSLGIRARVPSDTQRTKEDTALKFKPSNTDIQEYSLIKGGFDAQYGSDSTRVDARLAKQPLTDTSRNADESQMSAPPKGIQEFTLSKGIAENEKMLSDTLYRDTFESLYISLGNQYLQLYRLSLKRGNWNKANRRINEFLKKELSDSTHQRLLQIQAELKKLKK